MRLCSSKMLAIFVLLLGSPLLHTHLAYGCFRILNTTDNQPYYCHKMQHCRKMRPCSSTRLAILVLLLGSLSSSPRLLMVAGQQSYPSGDYSMSCTQYHADNAGYLCEHTSLSCETLAYFRVQTPSFSSLSNIASQLFNTTPSTIANASSLSSLTAHLKLGDGLYIPSTCSCNGNFSSHNITYTILPGDNFLKIANITYQGLTTCQAMQDANPDFLAPNLVIGMTVIFPLRCACPSPAQTRRGIKFLITYPVGSSIETISSVINMFGVDEQELLSANNLRNTSQTLFTASTLLLPFKDKPNLPPNSSFMFFSPSQPPPPSTPIIIRITAASFAPFGVMILILITIAAACFAQKFQRKHAVQKNYLWPNALASQIVLPSHESHKPQVDLVQAISYLATTDRLIVYTIDEINQATQGFCISMMIEGAVYRGMIKGQAVAVKKTVKNVSKEAHILQMLHHSNIISLLGFCVASPNQSYLVYEYAENGSLHGWLHGHVHSTTGLTTRSSLVLEWHNRLQIALDIALAMEYIHDHTDPRYVHNDIKSSNILLDSNMRGKVANFSSATTAIDDSEKPGAAHKGGHCSEGYTSHGHVMHTKVSPKADVYAFGQVLMEMVSGKETAEGEAGCLSDTMGHLLSGDDAKERLRAWIDPCVDIEVHMECVYGLVVLARSCVAHCPSVRPTARVVAFTLSKLLQTCLAQYHPSPL